MEKRGKFSGVKAHFDREECINLLGAYKQIKYAFDHSIPTSPDKAIRFVSVLGKKINKMIQEDPTILEERTEGQIIAELHEERNKANLKLLAYNGRGVDV